MQAGQAAPQGAWCGDVRCETSAEAREHRDGAEEQQEEMQPVFSHTAPPGPEVWGHVPEPGSKSHLLPQPCLQQVNSDV